MMKAFLLANVPLPGLGSGAVDFRFPGYPQVLQVI